MFRTFCVATIGILHILCCCVNTFCVDISTLLAYNRKHKEGGERSIGFEKADDIADLFGVTLNEILEDRKSTPDEYSFEEKSLVNAWRHADDQTRRIVAYALKIGENQK